MKKFNEFLTRLRDENNRALSIIERRSTFFSGTFELNSEAGKVVIRYSQAEKSPSRRIGKDTFFDFGNGEVTISRSGSVYVSGLGKTDQTGKTVRSSLQLKVIVDGEVFFESNKPH